MELNELLSVTACEKLEEVRALSAGDPNYKLAVDSAVSLSKACLEARKYEEDLKLEQEKLAVEKQKNADDLLMTKIKQGLDSGLLLLTTAGGYLIHTYNFTRGLQFEQTGSVTSLFFRNEASKGAKILK